MSIQRVAVYGSGLMGRGIAQVIAASEYTVIMYDIKKELLDAAQASIKASLDKIASRRFADDAGAAKDYTATTLARLSLETDAEKAVAEADLVIEAIVENLGTKQELFRRLDKKAPKHTIFSSNTSSLRVADMAELVGNGRKEQFAGLHFFNPVPAMKLVEIVKADTTKAEVLATLTAFVKSLGTPTHALTTTRLCLGKVSVICKDTPGFIVNRLLVPYCIEAVRLHEAGVASKEDIDTAMKLGAGYPMGPFELLDYVGLDTTKHIMDGWHMAYPNEQQFRPSRTIDELVRTKKFGRKSGAGFYDYSTSK